MYKKLLVFIIFILPVTSIHAQKEYWNWYFGGQAAISFNTDDIHPITHSYFIENKGQWD